MQEQDFGFVRWDDGILQVNLEPAVAIGGWSIEFEALQHFGGSSGLIVKSVAPGFNGASGITITDSGQGRFNVAIGSANTSGLPFGNYAYTVTRTDSGSRTTLTRGYFSVGAGNF